VGCTNTYLHVIDSVSLTGITRSSLGLSRMGGVIGKPITRPEGANAAAALDSCYTGRSGPQGFDSAAAGLSNLWNTSGIWNEIRCSIYLQAVRQSVANAIGPSCWITPRQRNHGWLTLDDTAPLWTFSLLLWNRRKNHLPPWFITNAFTSLACVCLLWPL